MQGLNYFKHSDKKLNCLLCAYIVSFITVFLKGGINRLNVYILPNPYVEALPLCVFVFGDRPLGSN